MQLPISASGAVNAAIAAIGRTEDVQLSPDNRRLAIAGFRQNRILVLDISIGSEAVELIDFVNVESNAFNYPHGLSWIDDETLAVANREGELPIVAVPRSRSNANAHDPAVLHLLRNDDADLLRWPGSVSSRRLGDGFIELLVCNNYAHYVSRHLLEASRGYATLSSDVIAASPLDVPDGIAQSPSGRWFAVSNHEGHNVLLYRYPAGPLQAPLAPVGTLEGIDYPHGLCFTPDGRHLLVADAGRPFVHVFASTAGDWYGSREASAAIRAIDEESFERGRANEEEGGPKGLALDRSGRVLVVSCEEQPIVFLDIGDILDAAATTATPEGRVETPGDREILANRLAGTATELARLRAALRASQAALRRKHDDLERHRQTVSWRVTAPLRWIRSRLRR